MSLVSLEGISVRLDRREVLSHVDLTIEPGEIVTIVGPNGSGKSTLLKTLIGALPLTAGRIRKAPGVELGYVPQKLHLDPTLPLSVRGFMDLPRRRSRALVEAALARVGVAHLAGQQISDLSGGQTQRVLLARALIGAPQILLLDEPTQGLDQPGSAAFYKLIEEIVAETGCAVVMVSHELHVVMSASDRVICVNRHICCEGTPEHVSSAPEYHALFGAGTGGALALYRHAHDHSHDATGACVGGHDHGTEDAHHAG